MVKETLPQDLVYHKLPGFVIGKSVKLRAFKNLNVSSFPVYYRVQKSDEQIHICLRTGSKANLFVK